MVHDNPDYNKYDINGRKIPTPEGKADDEEEDEEDEDGKWIGEMGFSSCIVTVVAKCFFKYGLEYRQIRFTNITAF